MKLMFQEDLLVKSLDDIGRLDREREFGRLMNVIHDVLTSYSGLDPDENEIVYQDLKRLLVNEYLRTNQEPLKPEEMRVWHISVFSVVKQFKEILEIGQYSSHEEVISEFENIWEEEFHDYLEKFSESESVEVKDKLPEINRVTISMDFGYDYRTEQMVVEETNADSEPSSGFFVTHSPDRSDNPSVSI